MGFRDKIVPLVLSGTLAFGTMGMPLTAVAGNYKGFDTSTGVSHIKAELKAQGMDDDEIAKFIAGFNAAAEEEAQAQAAAEESTEEPVANDVPAVEGTDEGGQDGTDQGGAEGGSEGGAEGSTEGGSEGGSEGGTEGGAEGGTEQGGADGGAEQGGAEGGSDQGGTGADDVTPIGDADVPKADQPSKDGESAEDGNAVATDEAAADKAADEKAANGKHAKKELTEEEKAAEAEKKYQENAKAFAESARERAGLDASTAVKSSVYESSYVSSNQSYTRIKYTTNLSTEMFIASIGEQARQIGQEKSLYASVMIAQAVIESDSGNSGLARAPYNNLFGIKGSYEGKSVTMSTEEDNGKGHLYTIDSAFRAYDTQEESLRDYADLLRGDMGHYYNAWKENAATYKDAARALQGTYATSTIYADTICAVIEAYDLTRYDEPLDFTITGKNAKGEKLTMDDYAQLQANAVSYLGTPYVWGGTTPDGFDCSGFVQYLYKQTFGIDLPRTTYTQQNMGKEVPFKDLQMGDLLFFVEGGSTEHVAMYLGDGFYIHAPQPGESIKITDMESFTPSFAKRIIQTEDANVSDKIKKAKHAKKADEAAEAADEAETTEDAAIADETEAA